jgi:hypothetical protein
VAEPEATERIRPVYSLGQLLAGVTAWSVLFGAMVTDLPDWVYLLAMVVAPAATLFLLAKSKSVAVAGLLSLPLICLANWSAFIIALGYVFGVRSFGYTVFGPIAWVATLPVVLVQNSVPLARPWSTIVGIAFVSLVEMSALIFVMAFGRRWGKRRRVMGM